MEEEFKFYVSVYRDEKFKLKPTSQNVYGKLTNFFKANRITDTYDCIDNFVVDIRGEIGAFAPVILNENRDFLMSNIFVLDFDKDITFNKAFKIANKFNISPNIAYRTLSSSEKVEKFRFVWITEDSYHEWSDYRKTLESLHYVFDEKADKRAKNKERWFFTGRKEDKKEILYSNLVPIENHKLDVLVELFSDKFKTNKKINQKRTICNEEINEIEITRTGLGSCQLYNLLRNRKILKHEEKLLLCSNLGYIDTTLFLNNLEQGINTKNFEKWFKISKFMMEKKYKPIGCKVCRFNGKCKNLYDSLYSKLHNEVELENGAGYKKTKITLESVDRVRGWMKHYMEEMMSEKHKDYDIQILKVPAGIGKTTMLLEDFSKCGVVAFPNHELKNEKVKQYFEIHNKLPEITRDIKEIVNDEDFKKIQGFYEVGDFHSVKNIVKKYGEKGREYIRESLLPLIRNAFTTHEKTLTTRIDKDCSRIFYDEDPINSLFKLKKYSYDLFCKDVKYLKKTLNLSTNEKAFLDRFCAKIKKAGDIPKINKNTEKSNEYIKNIEKELKKLDQIKTKHNVLDILRSHGYTNTTYGVFRSFPKNKKIFILSATPNFDFYYEHFKGRVRMMEVTTKRKGKVNQIILNTSKYAIENKDKVKGFLEKINKDNTITFKKFNEILNKNWSEMPYGGKVYGSNSLKGKSINVAYTYRKPQEYYLHLALAMGVKKIRKQDAKILRRKVYFNGRRFNFTTFNNDFLANLQMNDIDNELIQAVERARTITEDCEVNIFSNFISSIVEDENIYDTDEFLDKYEEESKSEKTVVNLYAGYPKGLDGHPFFDGDMEKLKQYMLEVVLPEYSRELDSS